MDLSWAVSHLKKKETVCSMNSTLLAARKALEKEAQRCKISAMTTGSFKTTAPPTVSKTFLTNTLRHVSGGNRILEERNYEKWAIKQREELAPKRRNITSQDRSRSRERCVESSRSLERNGHPFDQDIQKESKKKPKRTDIHLDDEETITIDDCTASGKAGPRSIERNAEVWDSNGLGDGSVGDREQTTIQEMETSKRSKKRKKRDDALAKPKKKRRDKEDPSSPTYGPVIPIIPSAELEGRWGNDGYFQLEASRQAEVAAKRRMKEAMAKQQEEERELSLRNRALEQLALAKKARNSSPPIHKGVHCRDTQKLSFDPSHSAEEEGKVTSDDDQIFTAAEHINGNGPKRRLAGKPAPIHIISLTSRAARAAQAEAGHAAEGVVGHDHELRSRSHPSPTTPRSRRDAAGLPSPTGEGPSPAGHRRKVAHA